MSWFKVIVLAVDTFQTTIEDERHFGSKSEADTFISHLASGKVGVVVPMRGESYV